MSIKEVQVGDTFKCTFINSGSTLSSGICAIRDGADAIVASGSAVSSGNGHYYLFTSVSTEGWYVQEWTGTINGNAVKRRLRFRALLNEVD